MNFYIGNSIDEIDEQDVNVEFSDELIDFIYKLSKQESFDMSKLYEIDPYVDVEVSKNNLSQIIEVCNYIIDTSLLQTYEEPDEGNKKSKIFVVLLIIIILGILASVGVLVYKLVSSKSATITDIDSIVVEGGTINEKFDKNTDTYTIESRNDSIKLICKYKNKEVNISECNKSILINKNEIKNIVISLKNKKYNFIVDMRADGWYYNRADAETHWIGEFRWRLFYHPLKSAWHLQMSLIRY